MRNQKGKDFSEGSIPRHLIVFSIPMLVSSLITVGYNIIDTVWVGHLVGENAVGALGVSFPILMLISGLSMGLTSASAILVAQYYGAKQINLVEKVVENSFSLAVLISISISIVAVLMCDHILAAINTPQENFHLASGYLKITLCGHIFLYLGFLAAAVLRGVGDAVTPLIFLAGGMCCNAVLDPLLIGGYGPFPRLGLNGAALASVISQGIVFAISVFYLNRVGHVAAFHWRRLTLNLNVVFHIFKIGLPATIQYTAVSMGSVFITTFVNAFGASAINAFGAVTRVDSFAFIPAKAMSVAVSTLTGQNIGAGKLKRVRKLFTSGILISGAIIILVSVMVVGFAEYVLSMFGLGNNPQVTEIGKSYLHVVGSSYIFFALMFISNGIINGAGQTMVTMMLTLLSLWGIRVPLAWYLSKTGMGINGIWYAIAFSFVVVMILSFGYYFSGRWKNGMRLSSRT